jgi:hypothetical protein
MIDPNPVLAARAPDGGPIAHRMRAKPNGILRHFVEINGRWVVIARRRSGIGRPRRRVESGLEADGMVSDFAEKLRLTAAFLGCASHKDLCAAFHRVNPNTDFVLGRSYKWTRGRAVPRSARVYEDWAGVLDIGRPVAWLANCTLEEFIDELCAHAPETSRGALLTRAGMRDDDLPVADDHSYLCGAYASYSHAQSLYFRGRIVRGMLVIEQAAGPAELTATYSQTLLAGRTHGSGRVLLFGRAMCFQLPAPNVGMAPLFFSLYLPTPPASVLAGVMCSTAAIDPSGQPPYAVRIVLVRVPPSAIAGLEASNRYLNPAEPLSRDLAEIGAVAGDPPPDGLDELLATVLRRSEPDGQLRLPVEDYERLTQVFDRSLIETAFVGG